MKFEIKHGFLKNGFSLGISWGTYYYFYGDSRQFQIALGIWRITFILENIEKEKAGEG